jgi:rubrerythrin
MVAQDGEDTVIKQVSHRLRYQCDRCGMILYSQKKPEHCPKCYSTTYPRYFSFIDDND